MGLSKFITTHHGIVWLFILISVPQTAGKQGTFGVACRILHGNCLRCGYSIRSTSFVIVIGTRRPPRCRDMWWMPAAVIAVTGNSLDWRSAAIRADRWPLCAKTRGISWWYIRHSHPKHIGCGSFFRYVRAGWIVILVVLPTLPKVRYANPARFLLSFQRARNKRWGNTFF